MRKKHLKETGGGRLERLLEDKRFCALLSLLASVVLWTIVVTLQPNSEWVISNIKVDWDYNTAGYSYRGLDILNPPDMSVKVKVSGDGSVLSKLGPGDFVVYPDYSSVTRAGDYTLKLEAKRVGASLSGVNVMEIVPGDTVTVTFDDVMSRKFPIEADVSELRTPADYFPDRAAVSPEEIMLRGPKSEIERITRVVAKPVLNNAEYTNSVLANAIPAYFDKDGQSIDSEHITADIEQVEVSVNVYKTKQVPLKIEYTGLPKGYDTTQLSPQLSTETMRVGGAAEQIDQLNEITVGFLDMTKFEPGVPQTLNVQLPEGFVNVDNLQSVTVNFNTKDFDTAAITVKDIRVTNSQPGVKVTVTTEAINDVRLVGEKNELEQLSVQGIVAQVDASAIEAKAGQVKVPVSIIIPGTQSVFATGTYSVLCIGESSR